MDSAATLQSGQLHPFFFFHPFHPLPFLYLFFPLRQNGNRVRTLFFCHKWNARAAGGWMFKVAPFYGFNLHPIGLGAVGDTEGPLEHPHAVPVFVHTILCASCTRRRRMPRKEESKVDPNIAFSPVVICEGTLNRRNLRGRHWTIKAAYALLVVAIPHPKTDFRSVFGVAGI